MIATGFLCRYAAAAGQRIAPADETRTARAYLGNGYITAPAV